LGFLDFSIIAGLLVVLSIIMVGCTAKLLQRQASLSSISVTVSSTDSLVVGATTVFKAVGTYSDNSTADVYRSRLSGTVTIRPVATLAKDGTATAVAAGSANISASLGITSPSVKLTVISLSPLR